MCARVCACVCVCVYLVMFQPMWMSTLFVACYFDHHPYLNVHYVYSILIQCFELHARHYKEANSTK